MGIADDPKEKQGNTKPAVLPKPCMSSSAGTGDHVIPQMVITSADDFTEDGQNGTEMAAAPVSSPPKIESTDIHAEEEKKDVEPSHELTQQRPLAVGLPEEHTADFTQTKTEAASSDMVCHSAAQRPLVFESEKPASPVQELAMETDSNCSSPSPILAAPTTMQRPLVFDGSVAQTEVTTSQTAATDSMESEELTEMQADHAPEVTVQDSSTSQTCESSSAIDKPKSSSFSWMPSFPKVNTAAGKDTKIADEDHHDASKAIDFETGHNEQDHPRKEGMQGVKKFFDSLIHDSAHESKDKSKKTNENPPDSNREIHKEEKHGIKNLFSSSKSIGLEEQAKETFSEKKDHKDSKPMKKFFDSLKHDPAKPVVDEVVVQPMPKTAVEDVNKPQQKDSKHGIKKFFDSFKHDNVDADKRASKNLEEEGSSDCKTPDVNKATASKFVDSDKQGELKEVSKNNEGVSSTKKIFDSFRHEKPATPKETILKTTEQSEIDESSKTPAKDNFHGVKKFFDSFKHDSEKGKKSPDSPTQDEESIPNITMEQSANNESEKTPAKDNLHGVKKFFDSFKHDAEKGKKSPDSPTQAVDTIPKITIEQSSFDEPSKPAVKDSAYGVKKFFDSFKHDVEKCKTSPDSPTQVEESIPKITIKQSLFDESSKTFAKDSSHGVKKNFVFSKQDTEKGKKSPDSPTQIEESEKKHKEGSHGVKKFFDSFKHEEQITHSSDLTKNADQSAKKQKDDVNPVKKFFDSFKHDEHETPSKFTSESPGENDKKQKESGMRKFLDSIKHDSKEKNVSKSDDVDKVQKESPHSVTFSDMPYREEQTAANNAVFKEAAECDKKQKDSVHGVKKFFESFKQDAPSMTQDSKKHQEEGDKAHKEKHGVRKFFDSFKHESAAVEVNTVKNKGLQRSQSFKESSPEKEPLQGVRSLFDFSHKGVKKVSSQPHVSFDSNSEHIYDFVDTSAKQPSFSFTSPKIIDSSTKHVEKQKDSHSVKKLFDSFRHKEPSLKLKIHTNNELGVINNENSSQGHSEMVVPSVKQKGSEPSKLKYDLKDKQTIGPVDSSTDISKPMKKEERQSAAKIQIDKPTSSEIKTSVFSSIGENILAIKDKVMHPKEAKKKDNVVVDSSKFQEYDLESSEKSKDFSEMYGKYTPITDDKPISDSIDRKSKSATGAKLSQASQVQQSASQNIPAVTSAKNTPQELPSVASVKSAPQELPFVNSVKSSPQELPAPAVRTIKSTKEKAALQPGTPETLYDTCCMKIAVLLKDKAVEIVSDRAKVPPKKPPKPSAEAIAKARAASVSRRLQELQCKGQSIGENIPIGSDGFRFADDETESSCDYKDVENFDYIMDYGLMSRFKYENKFDTFSVPSTCSGMTSYYTADTVTLKDESFSDAVMETVSLTDGEAYLRNVSPNISEAKSVPFLDHGSKDTKRQPLVKIFSSQKSIGVVAKQPLPNAKPRASSTSQSGMKKVPPPIPPKPAVLLKQKPVVNVQKPTEETSSVSQCINGLSLSPRLQTKYVKDSVGTQKRPLTVADVKETNFLSLRSLKSKDNQAKTLKDRKFDTVLKNESLRDVPSAVHLPLIATQSSPPDISVADSSMNASLMRKISPQRPPPPIISLRRDDSKHIGKTNCPTPPQKPKREAIPTTPKAMKQKRTISPPRPPPPSSPYKNITPTRPPPPNIDKAHYELLHLDSVHSPQYNKLKIVEPSIDSNVPVCNSDLSMNEANLSMERGVSAVNTDQSQMTSANEADFDTIKEVGVNKFVSVLPPEKVVVSTNETRLNDDFSQEISIEKHIKQDSYVDCTPRPPPRIRRPRSRTVEIVPVEKIPEGRLRRSHSLSDVDIEKKISFLNADKPADKNELKSLYTKVNKRPSTDVENVSTRPLPAPPPPPRKFRSLDRKPKEKPKQTDADKIAALENVKSHGETSPMPSVHKVIAEPDLNKQPINHEDTKTSPLYNYENSSLRPPRRKKSDKHRFLSLHGDERIQNISSSNENLQETKQRSASVPLKPDRRLKQVTDSRYDENANIAFPVVAEVHSTMLDECGNEIPDSAFKPNIPIVDITDSARHKSEGSTPNPRRRNKTPRKKSHSSWYDEQEPIEESWEVVSWSTGDDIESKAKPYSNAPLRRKSDPGKKPRETSKFYVDVEQSTENRPLVDKETSPLRLDCSEKSVQTSLETLSQGITSRDEESEDTDELLNLAQNLQNELKIIINRHKSVADTQEEDSNTPPLSEAASEKSLTEDYGLKLPEKGPPSVRSSTSELWPLSSSEESDGELAGSSNLTEIAMSRKQKKIFYIAQEIMTSEEAFVDALKLLNVDFKAAVDVASRQRNVSVIPDEILNQILNHLPQLQHLNENLLMELKDRIEHWDMTGKIADVIVKMGPFLKLYSWYIHDFEANLALLEDSRKKFPMFAQVVKEFEMSERCKRLALNHFMLKPIQRIPQYRLLLQEYLHHLPEDSPDYQDTVSALQIVSEVANHANESMKQGDNAQKLISIQNSILGHKEIITPGRVFIKEGELMKLSRKGMQPRWFVLFNDLLLYLTPVQQGLNRVNHELPLTGMKVAIPIQQDYQNEFSIISVTRSFTLAARSQEERQEWIIALTKAIEENASKRSTFTNIRLQQKALDKSSEDDDGGFVLGRKAPVWIPDARVTMCQLCTSEFTVTFRRHHCRACGKVVCSICSSNRISLPYLGNRIARVCDECHTKIGPGSSACTESGETDSDNQQIAVKSHLRSEHRHAKKGKRNLPSVLKEVCANDQGSTISGYLQKKSGKSWKRDWFVIKDKVLYEYKASEDVAALRSIPLLGYQIESFTESYENIEPSLLLQLAHPGQAPIIFHADTKASSQRWIAALKEASVLE